MGDMICPVCQRPIYNDEGIIMEGADKEFCPPCVKELKRRPTSTPETEIEEKMSKKKAKMLRDLAKKYYGK